MILIKGSFRWRTGAPPLARLAELASQVRERHAGNIDYRFSVDVGDPQLIHLNEAWQRAEDFTEHGKTAEVAQIGVVLAGGGYDAQLALHDVATTTPIPVKL
jgi:quinol monooxygenase YgiN